MVVISSFQGEFAFLSNFYTCHINYDKQLWSSVEHAYQAAKFQGQFGVKIQIRQAPTPGRAKKLAREFVISTPDWDKVKVKIMKELINAKFDEDHILARKLIDTGDAHLIEGNNWGDTFWGICKGVGENKLGMLLMEKRYNLPGSKSTKQYHVKV